MMINNFEYKINNNIYYFAFSYNDTYSYNTMNIYDNSKNLLVAGTKVQQNANLLVGLKENYQLIAVYNNEKWSFIFIDISS